MLSLVLNSGICFLSTPNNISPLEPCYLYEIKECNCSVLVEGNEGMGSFRESIERDCVHLWISSSLIKGDPQKKTELDMKNRNVSLTTKSAWEELFSSQKWFHLVRKRTVMNISRSSTCSTEAKTDYSPPLESEICGDIYLYLTFENICDQWIIVKCFLNWTEIQFSVILCQWTQIQNNFITLSFVGTDSQYLPWELNWCI